MAHFSRPRATLGSTTITMALNIPGVIMMVVFYLLILGTGLWGARKSRSAERSSGGDRTAVVLLGDRRISLLVGIFTMTGMWAGGTRVELRSALCTGMLICLVFISATTQEPEIASQLPETEVKKK